MPEISSSPVAKSHGTAWPAGSFSTPNGLVDAEMPLLKDTELRVLLIVLRQTWGWRDKATGRPKERDWLTHGRLKKSTGRASEAVSAAVDGLVRRGLIIVEDAAGNALATPAQRRRHAASLYFRLGAPFAELSAGETNDGITKNRITKIGKPKRTKDNEDNLTLRNSGQGNAPLTPEQEESIRVSRRKIRARLASLTSAGAREYRKSSSMDKQRLPDRV